MAITATQRHDQSQSVNERTSGRRIDAYQQFVAFRITETGNTDAAGKFTLTHTPVGSLSRQFDTLGRLNKEPDMVVLTAADAPLFTGNFDLDDKTIDLYIDAVKTTPAANFVGVKVSYWYYAPVKGTLNVDGTFTPEVSPLITSPLPVQEQNPSAGTILAKGITTQDGTPILFVDTTKNYETGMFVGKTAKLLIDETEYYRPILSNSGPGVGISPIQIALSAFVRLEGTATPPNGKVDILYAVPGEEGNAATIQLVENTSGEIGQPMTGTLSLENGVHLVITSATMVVAPGDSLGFMAADVVNYITNDPNSLGLAQYFSARVEAAGQLDAMAEPVSLTGGKEAIAVPEETPYEIIDYGTSSVELVKSSIPNDQPIPMQLSGSNLSVDPETGVKTVTSTAAEVFAGLAALDGRDKLIVYNEGSNNVYWGKGTVTPQNGFPLLPGDSIVLSLDSSQDIPIYFVAESDTVVRVGEMA